MPEFKLYKSSDESGPEEDMEETINKIKADKMAVKSRTTSRMNMSLRSHSRLNYSLNSQRETNTSREKKNFIKKNKEELKLNSKVNLSPKYLQLF